MAKENLATIRLLASGFLVVPPMLIYDPCFLQHSIRITEVAAQAANPALSRVGTFPQGDWKVQIQMRATQMRAAVFWGRLFLTLSKNALIRSAEILLLKVVESLI